ncbi:hypothetical protein AGMMS49531_03570 [Endomicrobiia bacterium]|nr:hypothetical protein AGMMS49531_03570 [Endomicrobiia bacterium]
MKATHFVGVSTAESLVTMLSTELIFLSLIDIRQVLEKSGNKCKDKKKMMWRENEKDNMSLSLHIHFLPMILYFYFVSFNVIFANLDTSY